jgi:hypothetical protein
MSSPGGIPLADLQNFASNMNNLDDIISLDVSDIGSSNNNFRNIDMDLLANQNRVSPSPKTPVIATPYSSSGTTFNLNNQSSPPKTSFISDGIDFVNIEDTQRTVSINPPSGIGADTIKINRFKEEPATLNFASDDITSMSAETSNTDNISDSVSGPKLSPEQEATEKAAIINKIRRLASKGIEGNRMTMANSLDEIKTEYARLVDSRNLESSIKFQRNALLTCVTGLEFLNQKFNPMDVNLDGWSESVNENQEDFDEIFEELYDKYKDRTKVAPEIRLIMTLGISASMCHVTNTFFKSKMPGMDDILKRNPDLARQFAQAAAGQAVGPGFANFVSMGMPQANNQTVRQSEPEAFVQQNNSESWQPSSEKRSAPPSPQVQTARREMRGPTGVEDILKAFEAEDMGPPQVSFTPPPRPEFDDNQSVYTSTTMNGSEVNGRKSGTRGGKRKNTSQPVGATIDLRV